MKKTMELKDIIRELYQISGFRISIYNTEREEIHAYPVKLTPFCHLIQNNPTGLSLCHQYDESAFQNAKDTGEVHVYRCYFGLYEAVAPLYHFGVLSGYLMMGQTLDTRTSDRNFVYSTGVPYVEDKEELKKAVSEITDRSKNQIQSCASIMEICAAYITLNNHLKTNNKDISTLVRDYIHEHFASNLKLEELCSRFYCSRTTLTKGFRQAFGVTVNQYITEFRLNQALELLKNTELSIQGIAMECGFSDQNYFTKVFQKHFHITPSCFRLSDLEVPIKDPCKSPDRF